MKFFRQLAKQDVVFGFEGIDNNYKQMDFAICEVLFLCFEKNETYNCKSFF